MGSAVINLYRGVLDREVVLRREVEVGGGGDARSVVAAALGGAAAGMVMIVRRGGEQDGPIAMDGQVLPGDDVGLFPRPGDTGTIILIALAVASSAASIILAASMSVPKIAQGDSEANKRYTFNRAAANAFVGDVKPVVLGERVRYGGKIVSVVPEESADGSGDDKLNVLINYGRGPLAQIGTSTTDADAITGAALGEIDLAQQPATGFTGVRAWVRMGTAGQSPIPAFATSKRQSFVGSGGVDLRNTSGSERTGTGASAEAFSFVTDSAVNSVKVRVQLPGGLYTTGGQLQARRVQWRLRWRTTSAGGGSPFGSWSPWQVITVERLSQQAFWSSPRLRIGNTASRVEVQAERVSVEPGSASGNSDLLRWDSVVEEADGLQTYDGHALLALELTAGEQIQSLPAISALVKGRADVPVHNGSSPPSAPVTAPGYSRNPADLALAAITNAEWGWGHRFGTANIDWVSFLAWRAYCAATIAVLSGAGAGTTTRPRFACDLVLDKQQSAGEWLRTICAAGRCRPVLIGNRWAFIYDRPQSLPVEVFTDASIAADESTLPKIRFDIQAAGTQRANQVLLNYESRSQKGESATATCPAAGERWFAGSTPEAVNPQQSRLDGVTDDDQAADEAVYRMARLRTQLRTVTLESSKPWIVVQPGERFDTHCRVDGSVLASGRIAPGSTVSKLLLGRDVVILPGLLGGDGMIVKVVLPDGTVQVAGVVKRDTGVVLAATGIDLTTSLPAVPPDGSEWYLESAAGEARAMAWTCTSVRCLDGESLTWEVQGVEYVPGVYDRQVLTMDASLSGYRPRADTAPGPVLNLTITEAVGAAVGASLAWGQDPADAAVTASFRIYRRNAGTNAWVLIPQAVVARRGAVVEVEAGDRAYEFVVVAVTSAGAALSPDDPRHTVGALAFGASLLPPLPPTGLTLSRGVGNRYVLSWTGAERAVGYQVLACAVTTSLPNAGAENALVLARTAANSISLVLPPSLPCRFWVRSVSATGRLSLTAATINEASPPLPVGMASLLSVVYDPSTDGTPTGATWASGRLRMNNRAVPAEWLGPVQTLTTSTNVEISGRVLAVNDALDPTTTDVAFAIPSTEADQWGTVGTGSSREVRMVMPPWPDNRQGVRLEVRTRQVGIWGAWLPLEPMTARAVVCDAVQARVILSSAAAPYRPALVSVGLSVAG